MQIPPADVLAAWPAPNYVNPVTHGCGNVVLNIVLYTVLCLFLFLRIWTRTKLRGSYGADDTMILLAMIPTTAFLVLSLLADLKLGWTKHQYDLPGTGVEFGLKMIMIIEVMFAAACTLTKLSMLMLVRRMLAGATQFWRRIVVGAVWIVSLQGGLFCVVLVFQCRPPQDYWKISVDPQPNCINQASSLLVAGIVNTLTDFLVLLLPIRAVYKTNLPHRQRLVVSFLFTLGFFSCFAGIIRTYYMWRVTKTWDQVWASYPVWVAAAVELYVGIICTSIPATKAFFQNYFPRIFPSHSSRSSRIHPPSHRLEHGSGKSKIGYDDTIVLGGVPRRDLDARSRGGTSSITSISSAQSKSKTLKIPKIARIEPSSASTRRMLSIDEDDDWDDGVIHVIKTVNIEKGEEIRR